MDIKELDQRFAVAPQIRPEDMQALAAKGYNAVICNRPDGEEDGQPDACTMRAAAERAGLSFHHIPIASGQFSDPAIAAFRAVRIGTPGPVLAYCRTGTRSITLNTLANPEELDVQTRLRRVEAAGYDLSALHKQLADKK